MMNEAPASSERMMTPDVVVTGEAVALEVRAASAGMRILSGLVDYTLYTGGLVMTLNTWLAIAPADITLSGPMAMVELSLILLLWTLVLPLTIEVLSRGLSAGRLITGTRVVRDDGGAIRLRHSLVRTLLALIEIWATAGTLASLTCAATPRGKRLGDLLAGTYVVHVRSVTRGAPRCSCLRNWPRGRRKRIYARYRGLSRWSRGPSCNGPRQCSPRRERVWRCSWRPRSNPMWRRRRRRERTRSAS